MIRRRLCKVSSPKIYDFSMPKVQERVVSCLRVRSNESTVADIVAATALPKYQVEQAMKLVLDEYAGRLKATESGELLYSFPDGMRSRTRGFGPAFRRFWAVFSRGAARVLTILFKIWIVAMLVGYFAAFVAILVVAVLAAFAASAAGKGERDSRSRRDGDGFGALSMVVRLLDVALRMWVWSSILQGPKKRPAGRPFYKSVFAFVFGEGDVNAGWEESEKQALLAFIRARRGVITIDELMALTGRTEDEAQALINRYLLEYEGEPAVTDEGTVIFRFPELLRTTQQEQRAFSSASLPASRMKRLAPFSTNKAKTNGWISFFNAFNLSFGTFFLVYSLTQGPALSASAARASGSFLAVLYSVAYHLVASAGINPVPFIAAVLGAVPAAFSILFLLIPLVRKLRQDRKNQLIKVENLRKKLYSHVLAHPSDVDPGAIPAPAPEAAPKGLEAVRSRILDAYAAARRAEPVRQADGSFHYRFDEMARQAADVEAYRKKVDLKAFEVGKTVFDSGE
jgi:hypothetical protein